MKTNFSTKADLILGCDLSSNKDPLSGPLPRIDSSDTTPKVPTSHRHSFWLNY